MGLKIESESDLDTSKLIKHGPDTTGARELSAFMQNIDFHISRKAPGQHGGMVEVENAMVILNREGEVDMHLRPEFMDEYIDNYYELYTVVFHELSHVSTGQFIEDKIATMFPEDFWRTNAGKELKMIADELLIKHLEHNVLKDDKYHEVTRKSFEDANPPWNIFWRGTPEEEIEDPLFLRLHQRAFSKSEYSVRETAQALKFRADQNEDEEGQEGDQSQQGSGQFSQESSHGSSQGDSQGGSQGQSSQGQEGSQDPNGESSQDQSGDQEESGGMKPGQLSGGMDPEEADQNSSGDSGSEESAEKGAEGEGSEGEGSGEDSEEGSEGQGSESQESESQESEDQGGEGPEGQEGQSGGNQSGGNQSGGGQSDQKGSSEGAGGQGDLGDYPMMGSQSYSEGDASENEVMQDLMESMAETVGGEYSPGGERRVSKEVREHFDQYRIQNETEVQRTIERAEVEPNVFEEVGRIVREEQGNAPQKSVIPDFRHDRRAAQAYSMGRYRSHYKRKTAAVEKDFVVFYDISPSQDEYVPYCNEIVMRQKGNLWKNCLFCFSGSGCLHEVQVRNFIHVSKNEGPSGVQNRWGDGGTNFNQVVEKIKEKQFQKAIIISDDKAIIDDENRSWLEQWTASEDRVLVLVHTNPEGGYGSFSAFADHQVDIEY